MIYLEYDHNLTTNISKQANPMHELDSLTYWHVKPITINNKKCYVLMEHATRFWLILTKLDEHLFQETLHSFLMEQTCLLPSLLNEFFEKVGMHFSYIRNDLTNEKFFQTNWIDTDFYTENLNAIENMFTKLIANETSDEDISLLYTRESHKQNKISNTVVGRAEFLLSFDYLIDTRPANKNGKYVNIKPNFVDPRNYQEELSFFVELSPDKQTEIQQNNLKLLDQFASYYPSDNKKYLTDFLNGYLLHIVTKFVTTDLCLGSYYLWYTSNGIDLLDEKNATIFLNMRQTLADLYEFLKRCGIINQNNCRDAVSCLREQMQKILVVDQQNTLLQAVNEISQKHATTTKPKASKVPTPTSNSATTYEIRTKLRGFKPSTWRTFLIDGNADFSELMIAVILMFRGELYHLYNFHLQKNSKIIYTPEDQIEFETFGDVENSDEHTVSELKLDKKYQIDYDYGDGWEFELYVKKILDNQNPPDVPQIINGKGYGIIEDIGGAGSLQIISDYQNGKKLNAYDKEFISDIKSYDEELLELDLSHFDKTEAQGVLEEFFNGK